MAKKRLEKKVAYVLNMHYHGWAIPAAQWKAVENHATKALHEKLLALMQAFHAASTF